MDERTKNQIAGAGLSAYAERIAECGLPCVYLMLGGADPAETSRSRIGGRPLLSRSTAWPLDGDGVEMSFVLQLDLAEVPLELRTLPRTGLLSVFFGSLDAHPIERAIFIETGADLELRDAESASDDAALYPFDDLAPYALSLVAGVDYPRWASFEYDDLIGSMADEHGDVEDETAERYSEDFLWSIQPEGTSVGKLFGYVSGIGHDPRESDRLSREWQHMITVDSCRELDVCIADAGYVQVLIHPEALRAADLSAVDAAIESS